MKTPRMVGPKCGRLVLQLAHSEGFRTINLVRRQAQIADITAFGGDIALCTGDADSAEQLAIAADGAPPSKAIDCVAGRIGGTLARGLASGGSFAFTGPCLRTGSAMLLLRHARVRPEARP